MRFNPRTGAMTHVRAHAMTTMDRSASSYSGLAALRDAADRLSTIGTEPDDNWSLCDYDTATGTVTIPIAAVLTLTDERPSAEAMTFPVMTEDTTGEMTFCRMGSLWVFTEGTGDYAAWDETTDRVVRQVTGILHDPSGTEPHPTPAPEPVAQPAAPAPQEPAPQERSEQPQESPVPARGVHRTPTPYSTRYRSIGWVRQRHPTGTMVIEEADGTLSAYRGVPSGEYLAYVEAGGRSADTLRHPRDRFSPAEIPAGSDALPAPVFTPRSPRLRAVAWDPTTGACDLYPEIGGRIRLEHVTEDEYRRLTDRGGQHGVSTYNALTADRSPALFDESPTDHAICPDCGWTQWHNCHGPLPHRIRPEDGIQARTHHAPDARITLPGLTHIRSLARTHGSVIFDVEYARHGPGSTFHIESTTVTVRSAGRGRWEVTGEEGGSDEVRAAVDALVRATRVRGTFAQHRAAIGAANEQMAGSSERSEEARAVQAAATNPESSWATNPQRVRDVMQAARDRLNRGEPPVPFVINDAVCERDRHRRFGIEVEFSDGDQGRVGQELARQGITQVPARLPYHWGRPGFRYHDHTEREEWLAARGLDMDLADIDPDAWQFEWDRTVCTATGGGEIVSPVLTDSPETWEQVGRVNEVVRAAQGRSGPNAGFHVHVSLDDFDHRVENHTALMREVAAAEDLLFRLGTNPYRGQHRGVAYCYPNDPTPPAGYQSVNDLRVRNANHRLAVNVSSVNGHEDDHVEFRIFDAANDPGIQQAQIKVCLAMVSTALQRPDPAPPRPLGMGAATWGTGPTVSDEEATQIGVWLDRLFDRDSDKEQVASLLGTTSWVHGYR